MEILKHLHASSTRALHLYAITVSCFPPPCQCKIEAAGAPCASAVLAACMFVPLGDGSLAWRSPLPGVGLAQHLYRPDSLLRPIRPGGAAVHLSGDTPVLCAEAARQAGPRRSKGHAGVGKCDQRGPSVSRTLGPTQVGKGPGQQGTWICSRLCTRASHLCIKMVGGQPRQGKPLWQHGGLYSVLLDLREECCNAWNCANVMLQSIAPSHYPGNRAWRRSCQGSAFVACVFSSCLSFWQQTNRVAWWLTDLLSSTSWGLPHGGMA